MKPLTVPLVQRMKSRAEKIAMLTAYDASFAKLANVAGVDVILVGDSLGMVVRGYRDMVAVTMEDVIYHTECVAASNSRALLIADLPFMSYATVPLALTNAGRLIQAGAAMVKLEGGSFLVETISSLTERGIPVCAHLGLTPQSIHVLGGYKVQGRQSAEVQQLINDARAIEAAGAKMLVLECVMPEVAKEITQQLTIPVIGIGAGPHTDGQVLVCYDMLGMTLGMSLTFVKNFLPEAGEDGVVGAMTAYVNAVKTGQFPAEEHSFS